MNDLFTLMPEFLRNPDAFFTSIQREEGVRKRVVTLGVAAWLSFMAYGFTVGLSKSWVQAISSAVKMPILFLVTMLFCLPALYFFSLALLGTPLKMMQVLAIVLAGMGVTAFLLLGLAPISLFFVLTSSNYPFFQLLAVAFVGTSASIGVYFLWRGMTTVETVRDDSLKQVGRKILGLWILLYAFVGTQMTWRLSPFVGRPGDPFYLIKPSRDNFYIDVIHAIEQTLNIPAAETGLVTGLIFGGLCVVGLGGILFIGGLLFGSKNKRSDPAKTGEKTQ